MEKLLLEISIDDALFYDPDLVMKELTDQLSLFITEVYQKLSRPGHYSNEQTGAMISLFFKQLTKNDVSEPNQLQILALTVFIDEITKKAKYYDTYRFRQNRFLAYFNELVHQGYPAMKEEGEKSLPFKELFSNILLVKHVKHKDTSPFETLLATWFLCEERAEILIKNAELLLRAEKSFFTQKLASLLYLQANDGIQALSMLKKIQPKLHQSDLIDHFLIMKQKQDYIMMKHWFEIFFAIEKPKQGTVLGELYEEMLIETGTHEEKMTIIWGNWVALPSYSSYKSKINKASQDEKNAVHQFILPKLKEELYRPQIEAIYYQICAEEKLFTEAINTLVVTKKDVSFLLPEIEILLGKISKDEPQLLLPFYHQAVERLVQKKSRVHYEEATLFLLRLKEIYDKLGKNETFQNYIKGLRDRFRTFRAFIQELNKIDQ